MMLSGAELEAFTRQFFIAFLCIPIVGIIVGGVIYPIYAAIRRRLTMSPEEWADWKRDEYNGEHDY